MDSVRFGRALGIGAREAAKAVAKAADAAAATNPSPAPGDRGRALMENAAARKAQVLQASESVSRGGKRFGGAVWAPLAKVSGVLWLEVTGVFFGMFLMVAATNAWKLRGSLRDTGLNHGAHIQLEWSIAMALLFGYFCLSSFVRARRRSGR